MSKKTPKFTFAPGLHAYEAEGHLHLIFDSQSTQDLNRSTRVVRIPNSFKQLSIETSGFTDPEDGGRYQALSGKVLVNAMEQNGAAVEYGLAEIKLALPGDVDGRGNVISADASEIAYTIRQACSVALSEALFEHYQNNVTAKAFPEGAFYEGVGQKPLFKVGRMSGASGVVGAGPSNRTHRRQDVEGPGFWRKHGMKVAILIPPALLAALLIGAWIKPSSSSVDNAVARQMANDPESIKAQVELTKQTLQSMGLDPGQGGDLGCLAPQ